MDQHQHKMIMDLAEKCGALRAALKWILDHSHECLDDHPCTLAHLREVYAEYGTDGEPK